jgi:Flp pilus assembly protein TadG
MHRAHPRRRDRRGAAIVEFAIVAPLLFLLVISILEFGWAMMAQTTLINAAAEGARVGVLDGALVSDVANSVNQYLTAAGLPRVTPVVSPSPPSSATAGQDVTVTVNLPFSQVSLLPVPRWLGNITLTGTSAMRRETSQ